MMSFFLLFVCLVVEFRFSLESSSFLIKLYLRVLKIDVEKKNQKKRKKTSIQHAKYVLYNTLTHYYYMYSKFT